MLLLTSPTDGKGMEDVDAPRRRPALPNVLITGTPGTGKTVTAQLASQLVCEAGSELKYLNVGDLVKEKQLHEGKDKDFDAFILDEDKLMDEMEDMIMEGGCIVDFHSCGFFPERWFSLVVVLRTDNSVLHPRLEKRKYSQKKINENMEAEIMQVCLDEARDSYAKEIVVELTSDNSDEMESNAERIAAWYKSAHAKANK